MSMFLFLVFLVAVVGFVVTRKSNQSFKPLVGNIKKVEAAVAKVADVNGDGKVDLKDVVAVANKVKKVRKPRAKKITPKKGK